MLVVVVEVAYIDCKALQCVSIIYFCQAPGEDGKMMLEGLSPDILYTTPESSFPTENRLSAYYNRSRSEGVLIITRADQRVCLL